MTLSKRGRKTIRATPVATAASTHADGKRFRHVLPRQHDGGAAFCGLKPGLWGWENQNGISFVDGAGYCPRCLDAFLKLKLRGSE